MADDDTINPLGSPTTNYGWTKPTVGADVDAWGGMLNTDLDGIDTTVKAVSTVANAAYPASNPSGYQTAANVTASLGSYLALSGGTLTGALNGTTATFGGTLIGGASVVARGAAGTARGFVGQTGTSSRWSVTVGNQSAETGGNVGSDFAIDRSSDAGVYIDSPLVINRANGQATFAKTPLAPTFQATDAAGTARGINVSTAGLLRWAMSIAYSDAESGADAGSNFALFNYHDNGTFNGNPLYISRATGVATFAQPIVNGSDQRIKKGIKAIEGGEALTIVGKLQGVRYTPVDGVREHVGLIAQDVAGALPEVVFGTNATSEQAKAYGLPEGEAILGVAYGNVVAVLIEAVKELTARVAELEAAR